MKYPPRSRFPKRILVRGAIYQIHFLAQIDPQGSLGECCSKNKTIKIRTKQTPRERFSTFIHELLHALEFEYNHEIPHAILSSFETEIISAIEKCL